MNQGGKEFFTKRMPKEAAILDEIRAAIPRDGIIASDSTRVGYWDPGHTPRAGQTHSTTRPSSSSGRPVTVRRSP